MKTYLLLIVLLFMNPIGAYAATCSERDAYAAGTVVDYLDSWQNLNLAYRQFLSCDDGGIAEGFSEAVARLLVDQWSKFNELLVLSARDVGFKKFVLSHIDGTLNIEDLRRIKSLVETRCPKDAKELCGEIAREADAAIKNP